ncbi:MAG: hypothetical protein QNJ19_05460 [Woeseiaceae bacterium]|nr:hypothetical protein [Woeseiaceae bacterium]
MELDWLDVLKSALFFGLPILIVGRWVVNRRQKDNEKTSEILRRKTR